MLFCQETLLTYFDCIFDNADGFIPCRSFWTDKTGKPQSRMAWFNNDHLLKKNVITYANWAIKHDAPFYVIPGTVKAKGQAKAKHVNKMTTILVDIDDGDTEEKLEKLTYAIGTPNLVVESGGITKEQTPKLHIYWKLTKPVEDLDIPKILSARHNIAKFIGGDEHYKSAHQPIRVAGSLYYKHQTPKLVTIRNHNNIEYQLEELIEKISSLIPKQQFEAKASTTIKNILTQKVKAGGQGDATRFNRLSQVIGYWIRRWHEGMITRDQLVSEVHSYNESCVIPPKEKSWITTEINALCSKHIKDNGLPKPYDHKIEQACISFSLETYLNDHKPLPNDLISPRLLTPGGILVFGGAPKVGKSDFLLSMLVRLAAGKEFLGFSASRPLKIFYFQAEIGYHYLKERLQSLDLNNQIFNEAKKNLYITPNSKQRLTEDFIQKLAHHINHCFDESPDIIVMDPIRNIFDGGSSDANENSNQDMLFFLQKRVELLKEMVNPEAGIILVHHTKKISQSQFKEEPFHAFSGASSLRGYYTSGMILHRLGEKSNDLKLVFELRNGPNITDKIISKKNNQWYEVNATNEKSYDDIRTQRIKKIIAILEEEAAKGQYYLIQQFAQKFYHRLGGKRTISDDCSMAATLGLIQFFNNPEAHGLDLKGKGYGFMCTEHMDIEPTHRKDEQDGRKIEVQKPIHWPKLKSENGGHND